VPVVKKLYFLVWACFIDLSILSVNVQAVVTFDKRLISGGIFKQTS